MNKQILIIAGVVAIAIGGLAVFNLLDKPERSMMDDKGMPSDFPQGDKAPQTSPTQNGERPQMPTAKIVDGSVFKVGDRIVIETDESGTVAKKITLLAQDAGFTPPSGDFPQGEQPEMPTDRENMPMPEGGPQREMSMGLMGEITDMSDSSVTISGRDGETIITITETTTFESL